MCAVLETPMKSRFEYLPYRRKFLHPLRTAHGVWEFREGIIVRLEQESGAIGFGEIAPVRGFGTESLVQALNWCEAQPVESDVVRIVSGKLPCCKWALSSAQNPRYWESNPRKFPVAALVNSESDLIEKQSADYSTFKTKIGVDGFAKERDQVEQYFSRLSSGQRLRLDANGGLSERDFKSWLEYLEGRAVEFLEQPLAPGLENRMLEMAELFSTPIALDESVSGVESLNQWTSWPGPLVVKPSLLGGCPSATPDGIVGSSVFETAFGMEAGLRFLARNQESAKAIGFGTVGAFEMDGWSLHEEGPWLNAGRVTLEQLQQIWDEKVQQ